MSRYRTQASYTCRPPCCAGAGAIAASSGTPRRLRIGDRRHSGGSAANRRGVIHLTSSNARDTLIPQTMRYEHLGVRLVLCGGAAARAEVAEHVDDTDTIYLDLWIDLEAAAWA